MSVWIMYKTAVGMRTCIDLNAAPIERGGHVVPNVLFVREEENIVKAHASGCSSSVLLSSKGQGATYLQLRLVQRKEE